MPCLNDEKLIQFFDKAIKDPRERKKIEDHIMKCDRCFGQYYFLFQAQVREREFLQPTMDKIVIPEDLDFIVRLDLHKPIELAEIALLKEDVSVEKMDIVMRSGEQSYPGFKVQKKEYPDFFLFQESKPNWILYLEDEVDLLTILIEDKIHYRAAYKSLDLLMLPAAKRYTLIKEDVSPFSFSLC